jgi:hypothetical protein
MITPDNFRARPLEWAGNQLGHMGLGLLFCYWAACGVVALVGGVPSAWMVIGAWALGYVVLIERPQGGKLFDTLEDIVYAVVFPAAFILLGRDIIPATADLFHKTAPLVGLVTIGLGVGFLLRLWQYQKNEGGNA